MHPLRLSNFTATSCLGVGLEPTLHRLREQGSGLAPCAFEAADLSTYTGSVAAVDAEQIRADLRTYDCRNNRLAQLGLRQDGFDEAVRAAIRRFGGERVGVFLGTSTSGILQTELAYRRRDPMTGALPSDFIYSTTQNSFSITDFVRRYFGITGPAMAVSTACSSSAKVFGSARRMLEAGMIDAAVVGGVDSLCLTTLYGFNSLELISSQPCRPFDVRRDGISIGEAAAFILLERAPEKPPSDAILLLGFGESSDAYHMSSPHPEGRGAMQAMVMALASADLTPASIDYINLHGTATLSNDAAEGNAVATLFGAAVPCSSTKGATGHTLGAAGGLEAVICALAMQHDFMPGGVQCEQPDPSIAVDYLTANRPQVISRVLSNSFGFGGTNCSLIFGRAA
ncbi:MAG: 3-oxoacyl-ACP synthase [Halothiobacillaceae bacterium]|nr:MAG: 3-oxoacyl-ACP synthase [Halothiobacillaceae bacterium]